MSDVANWRTSVNAEDYFGQQKKTLAVADRRPLIRKASDLVGPGIAANAVRITDFSDLLATYNGFFSAHGNAANGSDEMNADDMLVGYVTSDSAFGGEQIFTRLSDGAEFRRVFRRAPASPGSINWEPWRMPNRLGEVLMHAGGTIPEAFLLCDGSTFNSEVYPGLAAELEDTWGVHSGTTYYLPNFTDRAPVGASGTKTPGSTGGSATKAVPPHTHTYSGTTGQPSSLYQRSNTAPVFDTASSVHTHTYSGSTSNPTGAAFDVMNPWAAIKFIIRARY